MRPLLVLPLLAVAAFGGRVAFAEEPATYTIPAHDTWKVGDVATRTATETKIQKQKVSMGGAVVQEASTQTDVTYVGVLAVKEVDEKGEFTKAVAYFASWRRAVGDAVDESLSHAHVEISGAGAARSAKVVTPGLTISPDAAEWLDNAFGSGAGARTGKADEVFSPSKALAIGESWTPPIDKTMKMFDGDGKLKFVEATCTAKGTLTGVEGGVASLAYAFDLPCGPMAGRGSEMPWKDGGTFTIRVLARKMLTAGAHGGGAEMTAGLKGTLGGGEGAPLVELDISVSNKMEIAAGGEIPAIPTAEPATK